MHIRAANKEDLSRVYDIFMEIVYQRVYYPYDPSTPKSYIESFWVNLENMIYLAEEAGQILGAYILRPNQPAYGKHIANAAYMVSTQARGKGIGRMLGLHSLNIAREAGYHGMQFNFVVSTNENAVHLWKSIGFEVVGRAPDAFHHPEKGYVDALIMYQKL